MHASCMTNQGGPNVDSAGEAAGVERYGAHSPGLPFRTADWSVADADLSGVHGTGR